MGFLRLLLVLSVIVIFALAVSGVYSEVYVYRVDSMNFTVYFDGVVDVKVKLSVNETYLFFTVSLPGSPFANIMVYDSSNTPLDFNVEDSDVTVYSFGESLVYIDYETFNLTYKEGVLWTFKAKAPVDFYVVLPYNASITGFSDIPLEVTLLKDGRILVKMPEGLQYVSYVIPPGIAEFKLKALNAISKARGAIADAKAEGRTEGLEEAENLLVEAESLLDGGDYRGAEDRANQAYELALNARKPLIGVVLDYMPYIVVIIVLAVAIILFLRFRRGGVARLFRENPWLDEDEKNVLKVVWVKGGGAFESDIREALDLPKTTVWRIIKKLEEDGLVKVEKIRGENYVKLAKR
ncbi:winged helix-turn-helix transcriptional regulator [Candidatus Bathyarchaeota archaeon]|nr:winged helix-turn-helix transcriptional regulator [Candidatus Bathyarchaeota archaeon]